MPPKIWFFLQPLGQYFYKNQYTTRIIVNLFLINYIYHINQYNLLDDFSIRRKIVVCSSTKSLAHYQHNLGEQYAT